MPTWKYTLNLADIWRDESLTFEQLRDETIRRIMGSRFYTDEDLELYEIVDELADTDTRDYFDQVWHAFYDWADAERVWVATF
jgi:hypothetical protein